MRILLLPDNLDDWSAHNRTKQLKRFHDEAGYPTDILSGFEVLRQSDDEIQAVFSPYDVIHFNYSASLGQFLKHMRPLWKDKIILGYAIGWRWHGGIDETFNEETLKTIDFLRKCNAVTCLSMQLTRYSKFLGIKAHYITNGIDRDLFPMKKLKVGHVGPINTGPDGYKGGWKVMQACKILGLQFIHGGQYRQAQRPLKDMKQFYESIDVLVQPSIGEGCSNPIMEALAMGVRVICTPEGVREDLHNFVTLCTRDVTSIIDCLTLNTVIENWEDIAKQHRNLYDRLANQKS